MSKNRERLVTNDAEDVSLEEMLNAMSKSADHDVFRWFQDNRPDSDGSIQALRTMRLTICEMRKLSAELKRLREWAESVNDGCPF